MLSKEQFADNELSKYYTFKPINLSEKKVSLPQIEEGCFSNGVARGPADELTRLKEKYGMSREKLGITKMPGICELSLKDFFDYNDGNLYLYEVIRDFPTLKIVGFLEDWSLFREPTVWITYSESGYGCITDIKAAGSFDRKSECPWQWEASPTEDFKTSFRSVRTGEYMAINYKFPFKRLWDDGKYVVEKDSHFFQLVLREDAPKVELPFDSKELWKLKKSRQMMNYAYIEAYLGNACEVTFPEVIDGIHIVGICDRTRETPENYKKIESIHLPKSYMCIGKNSFKGCTALKNVILSDEQIVGDEAFAGCTSLEAVGITGKIGPREYRTIPLGSDFAKNTPAIGKAVFKDCPSLKKVYISKRMDMTDLKVLFKDCPGVTAYYI